MIQRGLQRAYRRFGVAYPPRALFLLLNLNLVVLLVVVAFLSFYVGMSTGEFVRLVLVAWAFELVHDLLSIPLGQAKPLSPRGPHLRPCARWPDPRRPCGG